MSDKAPDDAVDVEALKFPVLDWKPDMGPYLNDYLPRMVGSAQTTHKLLLESLRNPDYEYSFQMEGTPDGEIHPGPGTRLVSHQFGDWIIYTIWVKNEYAYHATVQLLNGMTLEESALAIYHRWITTRPKNGGSFGTGKSRSFNRSFKWKN
jgi:hypothetical protein